MTGKELLAEATLRYPIGTIYKQKNRRGINKVATVGGNFTLYGLPKTGWITDGNGGAVYDRGVWAEVVSLPEPDIEGYLKLVDDHIKKLEDEGKKIKTS